MINELTEFYKKYPNMFVHDLETFDDLDDYLRNDYLGISLRIPMDDSDLDETLKGKSPSKILKMAFCGHDDYGDTFKLNREYFYVDDAGYLISTNDGSYSEYINVYTVSKIIDNASHFNLCEGAQAIIDKWSK
ncbi:MAG: hypothetical protein PUF17_08085 [Lactimicrobium massiliense]|nr:hypothetical protein [Lactimicrobium massiliense]MDD6560914.1 hypothetical protein [Lactimicrobium massiliense]